jgi:hypothetical protein
MMMRRGLLVAVVMIGAGLIGSAAAQTRPGAGGGGAPGAPGGAGGFDPVAIRERIIGAMKTTLECSDDEWKLIEPKLVKVVLLKMDVGEWAAMGRMGRGGNRMSTFIRTLLDPNALPSPVSEREAELQAMIDQKETSTDAFKNKLEQVRKARAQAREELATAEQAVAALLTVRQEAALVQMGVLD